LLRERLASFGGAVEPGRELTGFMQDGDGVSGAASLPMPADVVATHRDVARLVQARGVAVAMR
jgi:hypothetical protein